MFGSIISKVGSMLGSKAAGPIISAGSSILGGILGSNSAEKQQEKNLEAQREFAQHGIRWKVADAKAAGLHPLAALGAQTVPYAPVSVGGSGLGEGLAQAGQDISRSMHATRDRNERLEAEALNRTTQAENLRMGRERHGMDMQRAELENALLASQLKRQQVNANPPFPSMSRGKSGDPNSQGSFVYNPAELTSHQPGNPAVTAGPASSMWTTYDSGSGKVDLPSQEAAESLEAAGSLVSAPLILYRNAYGRYVPAIKGFFGRQQARQRDAISKLNKSIRSRAFRKR